MEKTRILIVGSGWRVECYLRILLSLAESFQVTGVVTSNKEKIKSYQAMGYMCFSSVESAMNKETPDFILLSINMKYQSAKILSMLDLEVPILVETPIGINLSELEVVANHPLSRKYLQIAEQYALRPLQQAHLSLIQKGIIGVPHTAYVSLTNNYHAFSLMKAYLLNSGQLLKVTGQKIESISRNGFDRSGDTEAQDPVIEERTMGIAYFENGYGVYDFESNQHRSHIRFSNISVRGSTGEINNRNVKYMKNNRPAFGQLERIERGINENMEGFGLKGFQFNGEWTYVNPFPNLPFSDDDIATSSLLMKMVQFCQNGENYYSVDEAIDDMKFTLLLEKSIEDNACTK